MTDIFKRIVCVFIILTAFTLVVTLYNFKDLVVNKREIEDVDNLSGQRIGVISAYEGDYVLSSRDDISLLRYDSLTDALMALYYKRIDGMALTRGMAYHAISKTTGFSINDTPIDTLGYAVITQYESRYYKELNEFIKEFKKTSEYEAYTKRVKDNYYSDGNPLIEETGNGEVLKVGYVIDGFPAAFHDEILDCPSGFEIEMIIYYANAYNYKIEWVKTTESAVFSQLLADQVYIGCASYSDVYRSEFANQTHYSLSDNYLDSDIVLLEIKDYNNVSMNSFNEED